MSQRLPQGVVSFLFTDIEHSTALFEKYPDEMPAMLERHFGIMNECIRHHGGYDYLRIGDALQAAFHSPLDAVRAAVDSQRALSSESWIEPLKVRMGIHTGEAYPNAGTYRGYPVLYRCHRIASAAHGGQILVSEASAALVENRLPLDLKLLRLGPHRLKDLQNPEILF